VPLLLAAVLIFGGVGCRSSKVSTEQGSSVGQELMDLEKAHNQGVITDKEYAKLKKALIKKHD